MPIAVTTVVKDTFGSVFSNIRYKILCMYSCRKVYDSSRHRLRHRPSTRNTNSLQHWPSSTTRRLVSHSTHGPRRSGCLSHRLTSVEGVKGHQKGRRSTILLDLPFYKISARSRKRCLRYGLPEFFSHFR